MNKPLSKNEAIKVNSNGLRGTVASSLKDQLSGSVETCDEIILKHHGIYMQDDRDRRESREESRLERAYTFMARLRIPGGDISAEQWLGDQRVIDACGTGVVKITTRQTLQIHGVIKSKLKPTLKWFYDYGLDTIATAGDVNRNVAASSGPGADAVNAEVHAYADKISTHLLPKTQAWYEIWVDQEPLKDPELEKDPLYENHYLPRKFKIGLAVPPNNDTDVLTNDIALIAIGENGKLVGFNVGVGGGMGTTHGAADTYPRLASILGYVPKNKILDTVWQIVTVQRDYGNREERRLSRTKYTIDKMGVEGFKAELESRLGSALEPERAYQFTERADNYDWEKGPDGNWTITLFSENGRVVDSEDYRLKAGLKEIAETGKSRFRFTSNQNVMLTQISNADLPAIKDLLDKHGLHHSKFTVTRKNSLACVALNTCPLALAEGQRYLPSLLTRIEVLQEKHGIADQRINIRMTGCPNGCARPHTAEIGFIGRSLGHYNLHLGGDGLGLRMNRIYRENLTESEILALLNPLFAAYAQDRTNGETFGDYMHRTWDQ